MTNSKFLMAAILMTAAILMAATAARAATVTVTTFADEDDGACAPARCSLREAMAAAASGDTIVFDANIFSGTRTINLTLGELVVNKNLTVEGTSATRLTVRRSPTATTNFRIIKINSNCALNLSKMTVSGGSSDYGGGISLSGGARLDLNNAVVSGNSAVYEGGGIDNFRGTVNISDSSLLQNTAGDFGGGLSNAGAGATAVIVNSTIKNNRVGSAGGGANFVGGATFSIVNSTIDSNIVDSAANGGAGIYINGMTGVIANSTVSRNRCLGAVCNGGGINVNNGGNLTVYNSTVANNTAGIGGGILNYSALLLVNTTIAYNSVDSQANVGGGLHGGGRLRNTLIAGNTRSNNPSDVVGTVTSLGNNLVGNSAGSSGFSQTSNDIINPANGAGIAALTNNGGATETVALTSASPAINAGSDCVRNQSCATDNLPVALTADQRSVNRRGAVDTGAFESELSPTAAAASVVGRIFTPDGSGLRNARVTLTDAQGISRTVLSGVRGAFRFADVAAGETYIVTVAARRYVFAPQVISVNEDFNNLDFVAVAQTGSVLSR